MAHRTFGGVPVKAASAIANWVPVTFLDAASALGETVIRAGSWNQIPLLMTQATVASPGDPVQVIHPGEVGKAIAIASLGAGAPVAVGSTNGRLVPIAASGGPASANLVAVRWSVGIALKNAAEGDVFPVYLKPDQIV